MPPSPLLMIAERTLVREAKLPSSPERHAYADFIPAFFRIVIIGHQLVNPDWNRLRPTKAVNKYQ